MPARWMPDSKAKRKQESAAKSESGIWVFGKKLLEVIPGRDGLKLSPHEWWFCRLCDESRRTTVCQTRNNEDTSTTSALTHLQRADNGGHNLEPGIIFKGVHLQWQWFSREFAKVVPNWQFIISENGWTSNNIAVRWLEEVFIPQVNTIRNDDESRAVLLILDGHDSHRSQEFMVACYRHNINPCWLPAHTFYGLQPLDNGCFNLLKGAFDKAMEKLNSFTDNSPLGKINQLPRSETGGIHGVHGVWKENCTFTFRARAWHDDNWEVVDIAD